MAREGAYRVCARGTPSQRQVRRAPPVAVVDALDTLVNVIACSVVVAGRAHLIRTPVAWFTGTFEAAVEVGAVCISVTVGQRRSRECCCQRALIDVATVEAVSPGPCPAAFTCVPECPYRADSVDASCVSRACMSAFSALVNIRACDTIAREAWGTCAAEGARKVGAITGIEAVVRTRATFINLRARRRGAEVATHASACTVDKMRRMRRAGEAMVGCAAAASGAARVARAATAAGSGVIRRRAYSQTFTAKKLGRMDRTRSALARRATTAS